MPILNDTTLEDMSTATGHFGYSGTRIELLGATEYTLITIACDVSGSTAPFRADMEDCLREIVRASKYSPRADNLMLRLVVFDDAAQEVHGFKLLATANEADYKGILTPGGSTALYDASANAVGATIAYGEALAAADYTANAVLFVITDGCDNRSTATPATVKAALARGVTSEALESLVSVLVGVGVGDTAVAQALMAYYRDAGFTQFVESGDASARTLARLADFVSRSISAQSLALGTGRASGALTF